MKIGKNFLIPAAVVSVVLGGFVAIANGISEASIGAGIGVFCGMVFLIFAAAITAGAAAYIRKDSHAILLGFIASLSWFAVCGVVVNTYGAMKLLLPSMPHLSGNWLTWLACGPTLLIMALLLICLAVPGLRRKMDI